MASLLLGRDWSPFGRLACVADVLLMWICVDLVGDVLFFSIAVQSLTPSSQRGARCFRSLLAYLSGRQCSRRCLAYSFVFRLFGMR